MKELVCKYCANNEFSILSFKYFKRCTTCGLILMHPGEYKLIEVPEESNKASINTDDKLKAEANTNDKLNAEANTNDKLNAEANTNDKLNAEAISKISLLNWEIDKCLDEKDKERFIKLTSELNYYQSILKASQENPDILYTEQL